MAKYIEIEQAKEAIVKAVSKGYSPFNAIVMLPAADVRPVVRGRWTWQDAPCFGNPYGSYKCECGFIMPHKTNFCPNCGAKMEG